MLLANLQLYLLRPHTEFIRINAAEPVEVVEQCIIGPEILGYQYVPGMNADIQKGLDLACRHQVLQRCNHNQKKHVCPKTDCRAYRLIAHYASISPQARSHRNGLNSTSIGRR